MLDSLVDDKARAGAQEPPDDVHKARLWAPMVGQSGVRVSADSSAG
jgi:hypothetical protein